MRKFHNRVKMNLIYDALYENRRMSRSTAILDVGVGRGGDIFKWDKCNVQDVVGYDVNKSYIDECKRRYSKGLFSTARSYSFFHCETAHEAIQKQAIRVFDMVSCQFAIHYFFENEAKLSTLIRTISDSLKRNGKFIGTFMDGGSVKQLPFIEENGWCKYSNTALLLNMEKSDEAFGQRIDVYITDTLYFGEKSVSNEYVVNFGTLVHVCKENGLILKSSAPFEEFYNRHNNSDHFPMDIPHKQCSFLYRTFEFEKV